MLNYYRKFESFVRMSSFSSDSLASIRKGTSKSQHKRHNQIIFKNRYATITTSCGQFPLPPVSMLSSSAWTAIIYSLFRAKTAEGTTTHQSTPTLPARWIRQHSSPSFGKLNFPFLALQGVPLFRTNNGSPHVIVSSRSTRSFSKDKFPKHPSTTRATRIIWISNRLSTSSPPSKRPISGASKLPTISYPFSSIHRLSQRRCSSFRNLHPLFVWRPVPRAQPLLALSSSWRFSRARGTVRFNELHTLILSCAFFNIASSTIGSLDREPTSAQRSMIWKCV